MAILYGTQSDGTLIPVQADSQGRLVAELAGVDQSVVGDLLVTGDVQMSSLNGSALGGFRNWVMNGHFTVNQRGGDKTPPLGEYGFDRWKGVPGGLEQTIEALPAGRYTLSWTGGGMASIGGVTAPSAFVIDLPGGDTSLIVPATADFVQLEPGEVHTPFEHRPIGIELALSQRYFQTAAVTGICFNNAGDTSGTEGYISVSLSTTMRAVAPTLSKTHISYSGTFGGGNIHLPITTVAYVHRGTARIGFNTTGTTSNTIRALTGVSNGTDASLDDILAFDTEF